MNDNRAPSLRRRPCRPRLMVIQGGPTPKPARCFCGDLPLVEMTKDYTARALRVVACASCGASGPTAPTYDLAVAAWNQIAGASSPFAP